MYEGVIQHLIDELGRLPGVGPKGAQRIAFHLLAADPDDVRRLAAALIEVTERVRFCKTCGNVAEAEECRICLDTRRDPTVICVVEEPKDVAAVEKIREFRGRYHVLGGAISPIDGIGPDDLRVKELMTRLADGEVTELILATDPNLEGEATATFIARLVKPMGVRVTRPASGLPVGGDLEYADEVTLGRAFEGGACSTCESRGSPGDAPPGRRAVIFLVDEVCDRKIGALGRGEKSIGRGAEARLNSTAVRQLILGGAARPDGPCRAEIRWFFGSRRGGHQARSQAHRRHETGAATRSWSSCPRWATPRMS